MIQTPKHEATNGEFDWHRLLYTRTFVHWRGAGISPWFWMRRLPTPAPSRDSSESRWHPHCPSCRTKVTKFYILLSRAYWKKKPSSLLDIHQPTLLFKGPELKSWESHAHSVGSMPRLQSNSGGPWLGRMGKDESRLLWMNLDASGKDTRTERGCPEPVYKPLLNGRKC